MTDPLEPDYSVRIVFWRRERDGHFVECDLMPQADRFAVRIRVDGQARDAEAFPFRSDALRWAEERRKSYEESIL